MYLQPRTIKRYAWTVTAAWTLLFAISLGWLYTQQKYNVHELARAVARIAFQKDMLYRKWAASHGGVYVPATQESPPNPHLSYVSERDLTTPSGRLLTLINPAYMTRQVFEMAALEKVFVRGHITSLNPVRPENAPDPWERDALKVFESGTQEVSEVQSIDGQPYMRLMRPFTTDQACLKCHAAQGYEFGDIRGGISVSVPMSIFMAGSDDLMMKAAVAHSVIWGLGIGMIFFGSRKLSQSAAALHGQAIRLEDEVAERRVAQEQLQGQAVLLEEEIAERQRAQEQLDLKAQQLEQEILVRKRAETSALQDRNHLRLIMDSTYAAIYGIDNAGTCIFANKTCLKLMGYDSVDEVIGKNMHELIHHSLADGRPAPVEECKIYRACRVGQGISVSEGVFFRKDGSSFPVEYAAHPMVADGRVQGAVVSFVDVSERKRAEEQLAEIMREKQVILDHAPMGILLMVDRKIVWVNRKFEELLRCSHEDVVGKFPKMFCPDQEAYEQFRHEAYPIIARGEVYETCRELQRCDGSLFWAHLSGKAIDQSDMSQGVIWLAEDITERRTMEAQLHQAQKMESVGRLAGGVAHDFNNLLTVILGHAELALMKVVSHENIVDDLTEIRKAAERSSGLTQQLLAFARRQIVVPKVLDLNETVEDMLRMLRRLIGEDVDLAWQPSHNLWPVKIDPSQVDQILANLCVNSRDAISGVGRITIETHNHTLDDDYCATNFGYLPGDYVLLAVSDDGCGMDKETMAHVFEPFFTTKGLGEGTGLGLATVYGIVKQNNGFINIYSEPGSGTTFKIYLPRHSAGGVERVVVAQKPFSQGQETILLVEDEASILTLTKQFLEGQGYHLLSASTPHEAIEIAGSHAGKIHLLMTDVVLPEMNGRELARTIALRCPKIKCLYSSGYTANVIAHHGVLDRDVHFISKPFSLPALADKVREVLDS